MDQISDKQDSTSDTPVVLYGDADLSVPGGGAAGTQTLNEGNTPGLEPMFITNGDDHDKPVIVLDPGHSGQDITHRDQTGLNDHDYPNDPEIYEVWDVTKEVQQRLENAGYEVILELDPEIWATG